MDDAARGKQAAAEAVVALIEPGMRLGLGTGSTMVFVLDAIGRRMAADGLRVIGVPTSERTREQAERLGITLADLADVDALDLAIDGADEVATGSLDLVKGLGGALLREKIIQQAARRFVVVADESKIVARLGMHAPLPVEVVPFAHAATARAITALGVRPALRMAGGAPYRTDNGNLIYDCAGIDGAGAPAALQAGLLAIAGVVETGFFLGVTERAIIGRPDGGCTVLLPG
jgi:ribose 5-phosphate isomerase A